MDLNLDRPLCFFDLETTGVNISKDRIVEIAVLKLNVDGSNEKKIWRVNPDLLVHLQFMEFMMMM